MPLLVKMSHLLEFAVLRTVCRVHRKQFPCYSSKNQEIYLAKRKERVTRAMWF